MDANVTMKQIGVGNLMAVGARDFVRVDESTLRFRVGSKRGLIEKVTIVLEPDDTYTVRYFALRARRGSFSKHEESIGQVYCDQLGAIVRKMGDR